MLQYQFGQQHTHPPSAGELAVGAFQVGRAESKAFQHLGGLMPHVVAIQRLKSMQLVTELMQQGICLVMFQLFGNALYLFFQLDRLGKGGHAYIQDGLV